MALDTMVYVLLVLSMILAFGIGANDETMATVVGSGSLKVRIAVFIGGALVVLGCIILSTNVGKSVGADLVGVTVTYDNKMMLAVLLSTSIWLIVASQTGAPISTTHSVVGSIFGIAIIWSFSPGQAFSQSLYCPH